MQDQMQPNEIETRVATLDAQGNLKEAIDQEYAGRQVRLAIELLQPDSEFRGSRRHILDLLESKSWTTRLQEIIGIDTVQVVDSPPSIPSGHQSSNETDLDDYIRQHGAAKWPAAIGSLNDGRWWAPSGGTRPQMDLICCIIVGGKDGLLFVEAKAHEGELDWGGKPLAKNASDGSLNNHENIRTQIEIANKHLNEQLSGFNLSINSHYQLVNRLTYLWKLADLGIPVILMYLGFTKDTYFPKDHLRDDQHWQRIMGGYVQGVVPHGFPEKEFGAGSGATLRMVIRSCDISSL